jgi:glutaredoxin
MQAMPTLTLYGRPGCHLCDDARAQLLALRAELGFELVERDIEADDELHRRYLERIPVVALDGEELFDFFVDEAVLRERVGRVGGG